MARAITDLDNYTSPGGDYPNGRVKDNPGDNTGTKVNEKVVGDQAQFFQELMKEAGITPNGLPDNDYSGYQLYEAFEILRKKGEVLICNDFDAESSVTGGVFVSNKSFELSENTLAVNGDMLEIECLFISVAQAGQVRFFQVLFDGNNIGSGSTSDTGVNKHYVKIKLTRLTNTTVRVEYIVEHLNNDGSENTTQRDRIASTSVSALSTNDIEIDVQLKTSGTTDSIVCETLTIKYFKKKQ